MTATTQVFPKVYGILFNKTERWDVSFFRQISWHWSKDEIKPLGQVIQRKKNEVQEVNITEVPIIEKISFGGIVSITEIEQRKNYKGRLFWADAKDLIYSKIRVKQGSLAIVPENITRLAVSAEYPVYYVSNKIDSKYLELVLRSKPFLALLDGLAHGGSTKTRIPPEEFERLEIPLPSMEIQRKIVSAWQQAQIKAAKAQERVVELEKQISFLVGEKLGRKVNDSARPKYFALQWQDVDRWGVEIVWHTKNQKSGSHFPICTIGELCKIGSGGTPSRERPNYFGGDILWVKTTEVRNEVIFDTEEKITELGLNNSSAKIYPAGSLIVAMYGQGATRGRTAKLGVPAATNQACAVLSEYSKDIEPDYLWYYLMSEYDNLRLQASGNNQPNLNAAMIANYPVPVPPLKIQKEIIRRVEEGRSKIRQEQEAAAKVAEESESEVEKMILGLLKA